MKLLRTTSIEAADREAATRTRRGTRNRFKLLFEIRESRNVIPLWSGVLEIVSDIDLLELHGEESMRDCDLADENGRCRKRGDQNRQGRLSKQFRQTEKRADENRRRGKQRDQKRQEAAEEHEHALAQGGESADAIDVHAPCG